MPRRLRVATGGYACRGLDRAVGWMRRLGEPPDFEAFEEVALARRWVRYVERPESDAEWEALPRSALHGVLFGEAGWP